MVATKIQADLQLSKSQIGLVGAILFWTIAVMTPIAGYLGDVLRKKAMITGCAAVLEFDHGADRPEPGIL